VKGDRVEPEAERRHRPGPGPAWEESWYLDFAAADGSLAGYVRLGLHPADGQAWFWAGVVGAGPPLVTLRDHEVPLPGGRALELRASGLWTELVCETPLEHWSVGMEAFGVALDDPLEAWRQERGDPWALGLDVEWEALGPCSAWPWPGPGPGPGAGGYSQACAVSGDVLVGPRRFQLAGSGVRIHLWGRRSWAGPWSWAAGRLDDGTSFTAVGDDALTGVVVGGSGAPDGLLRSASVRASGAPAVELSATALAHAPVLVPGPGRLDRAFCRYETPDGRHGYGWAERLV
jgi:hypothetical protein